jgi:hypothetical protein
VRIKAYKEFKEFLLKRGKGNEEKREREIKRHKKRKIERERERERTAFYIKYLKTEKYFISQLLNHSIIIFHVII